MTQQKTVLVNKKNGYKDVTWYLMQLRDSKTYQSCI